MGPLSRWVCCAQMTAAETDERLELRLMTRDDAPGVVALARACYGNTHPHERLYHPELLIEDQDAGVQVNEVAVNPDGEVISHVAAIFRGPAVVEGCEAMTAERYRGHEVCERLEAQLAARVKGLGVKWIMSEPSLLHTVSQEVVVRGGGAITGFRLKCIRPVTAAGFIEEIEDGGRQSLATAFDPLGQLQSRDVWAASDYAELVALALGQADWPRTLRTEAPADLQLPPQTRLRSSFDEPQANMRIEVEVIGEDITEAVRAERDAAQAAGALSIELRIPTSDPAAVAVALLDEGFSYAAFLPELREHSDVLLLQWLADPQIDTDVWQLLNPQIETLAHAIVAQAKLAAERKVS